VTGRRDGVQPNEPNGPTARPNSGALSVRATPLRVRRPARTVGSMLFQTLRISNHIMGRAHRPHDATLGASSDSARPPAKNSKVATSKPSATSARLTVVLTSGARRRNRRRGGPDPEFRRRTRLAARSGRLALLNHCRHTALRLGPNPQMLDHARGEGRPPRNWTPAGAT